MSALTSVRGAMGAARDPLDESLTSLAWLQQLGCGSGLMAPLQTPITAPNTSLARRYAKRSVIVLPTRSASNERPPSIKQLETAIRKEHEIPMGVDWTTESEVKPPHNYPTLIYMAIKSSKLGRVTLSEIYTYIQDNFQFYRDNDSGWKNSIRHNLTQNKFFVRSDRKSVSSATTAKGGFWSLDLSPKFMPDFNRQVRRFGRSKGKTCGRSGTAKGATKTSHGKCVAKHGHKMCRRKGLSDNKAALKVRLSTGKSAAHPAGETTQELAEERVLLNGLSNDSLFEELCNSARVGGEEHVDIDSVSSDVDSRGTGGSESMEENMGIGWIVDNDAIQRSTLQESGHDSNPCDSPDFLSHSMSRLIGEPTSPDSSLNFDVEALEVDCMLDLVSSFTISDEERLLPTGGDLQVVGVGMSLMAPKDELEVVGVGCMMLNSPDTVSASLAAAAEAGPEDLMAEANIPNDWSS